MTLLQAAAQAAPSISLESIVTGFAALAAIGFWREMRALRDEFSSFRSRMETALFGADGDNGINGTVKDHEGRLRAGHL